MAFFKALKGFLRVSDRKAADSLENTDPVEFAKNDMEDMQSDLRTAQENLGHIKARMGQLTDDMKEIQEQIDNNTAKAKALLAKGTPDAEELARKLCTAVEGLEQKQEVNKQAMVQQEALLKQFESTKDTLEEHIQECQSDLEIMKTQKEVTDANKTLVNVDAGKSGSAVERFKERRRKLDEKLRVSTAMVEETKAPESLTSQADKLLGTTKGSALFASLKAGSALKA